MKDVMAYVRDYNVERLHTSNGDMSPIEYENYKQAVSEIGWPEQSVNFDIFMQNLLRLVYEKILLLTSVIFRGDYIGK